MKYILLAFSVLVNICPVAQASTIEHQKCTGILRINESDNYALNPNKKSGNGNWCDSEIPKKLVKKVLKSCRVGMNCQIEGTIRGHGTFSWYKINSANSVE